MWKLAFLLLTIVQSLAFVPSAAKAYSFSANRQTASKTVVLVRIDRRLRSAFLQRAARPGTYRPATSPQENIDQLQSHFDAVLEILSANQDRALKTALQRLERLRGDRWTAADRSVWLEHLSLERALQIDRLKLYQARGLFPQNEHDPRQAVPVFSDNYGTDCAVGHLMRESGHGPVVDATAASNNLVYVTDVHRGAMADWIAYSGLTQEEAALIQPAYDPPPFDATLDELGSGPFEIPIPGFGWVSHGGLRYENFAIAAASVDSIFTIPGYPDIVNFGGPLPVYPAEVGVAAGNQPPDLDYELETAFDDWLFLGRTFFDFNGILSTDVLEGDPGIVALEYAYDVVATVPGMAISAASITNQPIFHFNYVDFYGSDPQHPGRIVIDTTISATLFGIPIGTPLATLHIDSEENYSGFFFGNDDQAFAPQQSIRVATRVLLENNAMFNALTHSFQLVPEPASWTLGLLLGCPLLLRRRRIERLH